MKLKYIFRPALFAFAAILPVAASAQGGLPPGLYAGADVTKSVFMQGLILEPVVKLRTNSLLTLSLTYGHASLTRDPIYENVAYRNKGSYFKPGAELMLGTDFVSLGLSYLISNYTETGETTLPGPYWGDVTMGYHREMQTKGIEGNLNIYLPATNWLTIQLTGRFISVNNHIVSGNNRDVPVFYAPGAGRMREDDSPSQATTAGFSAGLLFKLFSLKSAETPIQ